MTFETQAMFFSSLTIIEQSMVSFVSLLLEVCGASYI